MVAFPETAEFPQTSSVKTPSMKKRDYLEIFMRRTYSNSAPLLVSDER